MSENCKTIKRGGVVMYKKKKFLTGFTLIEMLLVIVIIGVLMVITIPRMGTFTNNSNKGSVETDMRLIKSNLQNHYIENPSEPLTKDKIEEYTGLSVELESASSEPSYYEVNEKLDPWGQPYRIIVGNAGEIFFAVHSYGPNTQSDISTLSSQGDIKDDLLLLYYPQLQ